MERTPFDPGPLAEVDCRSAGEQWSLIFVRDLRHPPEKVWAALTEPDQLREWAPYLADRNLGGTGDAVLTMIDGDVAEELPITVRRSEPPTLLEYTWGGDLLCWELAPTERGTRLTLRHTTAENRAMVPTMAAGWHICLVVADRLLDGRPVGPIRGHDALNYGFQELSEGYSAKLGIEADQPGTQAG
jgi:uncharacterized protein YndB with AHSA1/START domain